LNFALSVTTPTWDHETFKLGYAMDAQMVEHSTRNLKIKGSHPATGTGREKKNFAT
jgi:hypothetical protein